MKIHLTPDELEAGFRESRLSPKKLAKFIDEKAKCPLLFLSEPSSLNKRRVIGVFVTELIGAADGKTRMSFETVSAQAFTVFDAKTKDLNQVTLLTPQGQFTFSSEGTRKTAVLARRSRR